MNFSIKAGFTESRLLKKTLIPAFVFAYKHKERLNKLIKITFLQIVY